MKFWNSVLAAFVALILLDGAAAQIRGRIEDRPPKSWVKADNGFLISWKRGIVKDSTGSQIFVFDTQGGTVLKFETLALVPDAKTVSIYDVSVRAPQMVAVAAVYGKGDGTPNADTLLYFDFKGNLRSAFALEPSREIAALEIDEDLNVWTVTESSSGKSPSQVPMVVVYDANGVKKELLKRDSFPRHALSNDENPEIGSVASGYESGIFWFWLPGSTDLVTISTKDGSVARAQTGLPPTEPGSTQSWPLLITRESSGALVAQMGEGRPNTKAHLAHYSWSPETSKWSAFAPGVCRLDRLVGVHNDEQLYVTPDSTNSICAYSRK